LGHETGKPGKKREGVHNLFETWGGAKLGGAGTAPLHRRRGAKGGRLAPVGCWGMEKNFKIRPTTRDGGQGESPDVGQVWGSKNPKSLGLPKGASAPFLEQRKKGNRSSTGGKKPELKLPKLNKIPDQVKMGKQKRGSKSQRIGKKKPSPAQGVGKSNAGVCRSGDATGKTYH